MKTAANPAPTRDTSDLEAGLFRAATWLAVSALPFLVFILSGPTQFRLVILSPAGGAVLVAGAALAYAGARLRRRPVIALAGVVFALAALLQLAQFGRGPTLLGGGGSMIALFGAFCVRFLALGLVRLPAPASPAR